ncbi:hypothetical protein D3C71_1367990 [compost metagenome]
MSTVSDIIERIFIRIDDVIALHQLSLKIGVVDIHTGIYNSYNNVIASLRQLPAAIRFNNGQIPLIFGKQ